MKSIETQTQIDVVNYIEQNYPGTIYHSDFGSGVKLQVWQAKLNSMLNGGKRGWPDLFIAEPRAFMDKNTHKVIHIHGLFIELKKPGERIYKRNGDLVSDEHIVEQAQVLKNLRKHMYAAEFAVGFDEAKKLIDDYLGGKNE